MKMRSIFIPSALVGLVFSYGFIFTQQAIAAPCTGLPATQRTISGEICNISTVIGVDQAANIETSVTNVAPLSIENSSITINPSAALVFGNLSLGSNVTIALADGAQLLPGKPLYAADIDGDGWPANDTYFTSTASGRRRLSLMRSWSTFDCDDSPGNFDVVNTTGPWYEDSDGDGKGNPSITSPGCTTPPGYVANNTDCNDGSNQVWVSHSQCYADADGDTYTGGLAANTTCINASTCDSATRASNSTKGAAVTTYTAGRLRDAASATADCYDANANAKPGSTVCSSTHRGDGSFDYNCVSGATKCGTTYNYSSAGTSVTFAQVTGSCKNCNVNCGSGSNTVYSAASIGCGQTGAVCTSFNGQQGGSCGRNVGEMCSSPYQACSDYHMTSNPSGGLCNGISTGVQACQ